jgi:hypothetical protein
MVYQTWYRAMPLQLAQVSGTHCPGSLVPAMSRMERAMSRPQPRAAEVIEAGGPIISALEQWQTACVATAESPNGLTLFDLVRASVARPIERWDEAEQLYLGLSALGRNHNDRFPMLQLSRMSELLGPGPNQPGRPYDPAPIRAEILRIADIINPPHR